MIDKFKGDFLQWLRGFFYTAQKGSVSKAADHLGLIQSAVSHHIRCLEKNLEVQLFHRGRKEMELTDEGRILMEKTVRLFELIREIREEVGRKGAELKGYIRISTTFSVAIRILPDMINEFKRMHPGVRFSVNGDIHSVIKEDVLTGSADFGILTLQSFPDAIEISPLFTTPVVLVSPKGNPFRLPRPAPLEAVVKTPFVTFPPGNTFDAVLRALADSQGVTLNVAAETNSVEPMLRYVASGIGVAVLDKFAMTGASETLESFDVSPPFPPRRYVMITRQGKYLAPQVKAFQKMLGERLAAAVWAVAEDSEINNIDIKEEDI